MSIANSLQNSVVQWQFIHEGPAWTWRKILVNGALDLVSGREFSDYALAVHDAINHGFRPSRDYWVIVTRNGTTHFRTGLPPAFVPRKDSDPFPPPAPTETTAQRVRTPPKSVPEQ